MDNTITIGQTIHATKMAADSFYLEAKGIVTEIKNGFVCFTATEVKDRWSKEWSQHPGSCSTSTEIENAMAI
jgi:hypothetical protein